MYGPIRICKWCDRTSEQEVWGSGSAVKPRGRQCKVCRNGIYKYELNRKQQQELLDSQDGKCMYCFIEITLNIGNNKGSWTHSKENNLAIIEHNHNTGKVRGVSCVLCNKKVSLYEQDNYSKLSGIEIMNNIGTILSGEQLNEAR